MSSRDTIESARESSAKGSASAAQSTKMSVIERLKCLLAEESLTIEPERLRQSLSKLVLIRVVILSVILGISSAELIFSDGAATGISRVLFWSIGLVYGVSLANALVVRKSERLLRLAYIQLALDVFLATVAISVTTSPFSIFLYLLVIVAAAVVCGRGGAVLIGALCGLAYAMLAAGLLPLLRPSQIPPTAQDILVVYLSMVVIALVSGYLARELRGIRLKADAHARSLIELNEKQKQLFDDISEGIVMLDLAATITSLNSAARSILGISELESHKLVGQPLNDLLTAKGLHDDGRLTTLQQAVDGTGEISLQRSGGEGEIRLDCSVRQLTGNQGKMLIFHDVSHVRSIEEQLKLHEKMTALLAQGEDSIAKLPANFTADHRIAGDSPVMKQVFNLVERVAASEASVLVSGESGTGKELIAKSIHTLGKRRDFPFVAINCAAIPENLIESELFGHKKGSFTGAIADSPGLFRQAQGGTIFLDEIGELPLQMQTKLLRVLQERHVRPVGDVRDYPVDVRVVAATNRDLKHEIANGGFREDLYYRLNVVSIVVPPLRDRKEDIPLLVRHFIGNLCSAGQPLPQVSPEALQLLMNYPFPGNIRELENIVERALVLGGQAILPEHLPEEVISNQRRDQRSEQHNSSKPETEIVLLPIDLESVLATIERDYLERALSQSGGVKKNAAELLGLNFRSFRYRLKKYGMGEAGGLDTE